MDWTTNLIVQIVAGFAGAHFAATALHEHRFNRALPEVVFFDPYCTSPNNTQKYNTNLLKRAASPGIMVVIFAQLKLIEAAELVPPTCGDAANIEGLLSSLRHATSLRAN